MPYFEPYPLTALDHLLMPAYMHLFLAFQPSNIAESIATLKNGMSGLIQEWPFLAGSIAKPGPERPNQKAYEVQPPSKSELQTNPMLHVKAHAVPISALGLAVETPNQLIPVELQSPTPYPAPALRFQANIMTDGLILTASWHHRFMDAFGCHAAFDGLSQFCRLNSAAGVTLKTCSQMQEATRQQIRNIGGSAKNRAAFAGAYNYAEGHYQDNQITRGYALCPRKVKILRELCNSRLAEIEQSLQSRLTCDDIVTAVIWLSAAQARSRAFSAPRSSLLRYVNVRKMLSPCISPSFFGNAIAVSKSHCNVHDLPSKDRSPHALGYENIPGLPRETIKDLSHLAWLIRSADTRIDTNYVGDILSTLRASLDWDSLSIIPSDVAVSSMRKFPFYSLDFGESFGPVMDVDFVDSNLHGMCIIRPARNCAPDAPWEIRMALPKEAFPFVDMNPLISWAKINERPRL